MQTSVRNGMFKGKQKTDTDKISVQTNTPSKEAFVPGHSPYFARSHESRRLEIIALDVITLDGDLDAFRLDPA